MMLSIRCPARTSHHAPPPHGRGSVDNPACACDCTVLAKVVDNDALVTASQTCRVDTPPVATPPPSHLASIGIARRRTLNHWWSRSAPSEAHPRPSALVAQPHTTRARAAYDTSPSRGVESIR